jgi:acyl-CoA thioesterase-1
MNELVYLFGSGAAFFVGIALILAGLAIFTRARQEWARVVATLVAVLGLVFVAFSSTPLPYWLYAIAGVITLPWLVAERSRRPWLLARRRGLRWAVAVVWLAAAAVEFPYHLTPTLAPAGRPQLFLLGDSISTGMGERQPPWPRLLAAERSIPMTDLSLVGATVESALRQADRLPADGGLVLLEIGGNDLLGSTSAADFERGLEQLLKRVCVPGRPVVMFELPLPPFCNDYGLAQRRLAARYGVALIPKRILMAVLAGDNATLDSIHLTAAGHERLAAAVWDILRPAYGE